MYAPVSQGPRRQGRRAREASARASRRVGLRADSCRRAQLIPVTVNRNYRARRNRAIEERTQHRLKARPRLSRRNIGTDRSGCGNSIPTPIVQCLPKHANPMTRQNSDLPRFGALNLRLNAGPRGIYRCDSPQT